MELPFRARGDETLRPGAMLDLRQRLRRHARRQDVTTVIACAFDHRTRILPFLYADMRMAPAGVRAIGSAMADAGFHKTRIVLQQWNRNFRPSQMRLDGRVPDIFMVSSMHLHSAECLSLIRDASRIDPRHRPLIVAGGPLAMYQPWDVFSADPQDQWGADVAVTGEEYVLLDMLDIVLGVRGGDEPVRAAFERARDSGALDEVPGLVYGRVDSSGTVAELVDTGVQRLLRDLDELPHPVHGYRLLEPPSTNTVLAERPLSPERVGKYCTVSSVVLTFGCKFRCHYCPIPAYNQNQFRAKSGERVADEFERIHNEFGIRFFFGADDNFFNDEKRTLDIVESLARKVDAGSRPHSKIRWATEATIHDTLRLKDHLPLVRKAGLNAVWLGVEDITATLVRKGQREDKTLEAFRVLRKSGISPVPMLMHHDGQPLYSRKSNYGLLNQLRLLRKAGAIYTQVLMLSPAMGSNFYEDAYTSGLAYESANGVKVSPNIADGNYVIASRHPRPWVKQLNLLAGYVYFFNPVRFLLALVRPKSRIPFADAETTPLRELEGLSRWNRLRRRGRRKLKAHLIDAAVQAFGMWGLLRTGPRTLGWCWHLARGRIVRHTQAPASRIPMRGVDNGPASHDLPRESDIAAPDRQASSVKAASGAV